MNDPQHIEGDIPRWRRRRHPRVRYWETERTGKDEEEPEEVKNLRWTTEEENRTYAHWHDFECMPIAETKQTSTDG